MSPIHGRRVTCILWGNTMRKHNGNFDKVREICERLYRQHGGRLRRKHVMAAAKEAGVPAPTASEVWQAWRQPKNL
jgi:hypothetical protein